MEEKILSAKFDIDRLNDFHLIFVSCLKCDRCRTSKNFYHV